MPHMRHVTLLATLAVLLAAGCARSMHESGPSAGAATGAVLSTTNPLKFAARPTSAAIDPTDLMSRLYVFADDSMMGRASGHPGNDKGTAYLERELRALGLEPAGENGTYFQQVLEGRFLTVTTPITVDGRTLALGTDLLARQSGTGRPRPFDGARVIYGGVFGDPVRMIPPTLVSGKVVVFTVAPNADGTPAWQANRQGLTVQYTTAAAVVVATLDAMPAAVRTELAAPAIALRGGGQQQPTRTHDAPAFFYATRSAAEAMLGAPLASVQVGTEGRVLRGALGFRTDVAPGRNVIAVLRGSDPALRNQYVLVGSHNDHEGVAEYAVDHDSLRAYNAVVRPGGADSPMRPATSAEQARIRSILDSLRRLNPRRADNVYNGADDDGSGSVAMLEIAEAMAKAATRPRRSVLFIWHAAEEQGLFGSQYFSEHPTVPRDSIVAGINIDMIGRGNASDLRGGGPGYLQLIGSRRLSSELGDLVEAVNRDRGHALAFDYQYDASNHPEQYYCRSDHYNYARWGIPVVFFSTGGHRDYHQLTDEPQYIDYDKLARVSRFIHDVTLRLATLDRRPTVDKPKPDPYGDCRQ